MEHEGDGDTICKWYFGTILKDFLKGSGGHGNKRKSGDHPDYWIIQIGHGTKNWPGDFWRLVVSQTTVENYQVTLMWKNSPNIIKKNHISNWIISVKNDNNISVKEYNTIFM